MNGYTSWVLGRAREGLKEELETNRAARKTILLVEDSEADVELVRRSLIEGPQRPELIVVEDGVVALQLLRSAGQGSARAIRPDLILLDLNLPRKSGHQVLAELKQDPELRSIPVLVLTSSHAESDIAGAYDLHANCYLTKPMDLDTYVAVLRSLQEFWLFHATLPSVHH